MKRIIQLLLALAVALPLIIYTPARAAQPLPGLSVSGTQIVANGVPVRLRGINMGDPFWARNPDWYPIFSVNDYATLAQQWHANVVRISIFPTQWKNMDHTQLIDGLAREVNAALANGLYVIISYHVIGWPDGFYQAAYPGNPADTYDSSMAVATSFWNQMSLLYGSDSRIIFDLWNEPVHPDDFTLYGSDPNPLWPILKGYYEGLIQTVRNNHAQNIVIATGNRWASWLVGIKDNPLSDPNVIYAYHQYSVEGSNTPSEWNRDTGGLIGVEPVIVSEWGYEDADAGANPQWPGTASSYGIPFTTWLEDNGLSNLAWMYHYDWTPAMLKADGSLTLYGGFVKNYLFNHNPPAGGSPVLSGCPMFPPDNIWNTPVNNLPVDPHSSNWVNSIGSDTGFHMDFGSDNWDGGPIGIPYNVGSNTTPKYTVGFLYADESDPGPYPIPASPAIEYGSDHHLLVLDQSACKLYELYAARQNTGGAWLAGSGAIWDLNSDALRPDGWTSGDAAGLPILPGLVRYDEVAAGQINHAIRFTANSTDSYIWPARHLTSGTPGVLTSTPPMGARFRLKASFDISGYPAQLQVILQAMKTYGIILADNGSDWYISGAPDSRWNNDTLHLLDNLTGSDFEAVDSTSLMVDPNSGATVPAHANVNIAIGGTSQGSYSVLQGTSARQNYAGVNNGPVRVTSTNNMPIIASERVAYTPDGGTTWPNYSELMGLPAGQLTSIYVMPWYNNVDLNTQIRFGNAGTSATNVTVRVAGVVQGTYPLAPSQSARVSYAGLNNGPVVVYSSGGVPIIASERVAYYNGSAWTGFSELMGFPAGQLSSIYVMPWYNNVDLNTQLRFGNAGTSNTTVTVAVAGVVQGTYPLAPSQSTRVSYAGLNNGPVVVYSSGGVPIIASQRVAYYDGSAWTSFTELMGLPVSQLTTSYVMPLYNNTDLNTQLRFGNVGSASTTVTVTVSGVVQGTYPLAPSQSARVSYAGLNNGPVVVSSSGGVAIIASQRVAYYNGSAWTNFAELMGLPSTQLTTSYVMPWYNNADLNTQLRFAVP